MNKIFAAFDQVDTMILYKKLFPFTSHVFTEFFEIAKNEKKIEFIQKSGK